MNDTTQAPFAFMPATPKGQQAPGPGENAITTQNAEKPKRTRRTKAELAAAQGEKPVDAFDAFDSVFEILDPLPKPVRDRIMSTLNRIYS
jgi:hypothetical protein